MIQLLNYILSTIMETKILDKSNIYSETIL